MLDALLFQVSSNAFADEAACVKEITSEIRSLETQSAAIEKQAVHFIESIRKQSPMGTIEAFQHEYGLNTREGIMMMSLAEALLRIPDAATADALIHDKLVAGDWDKHIGDSHPWLVSIGGFGLHMAGKILREDGKNQSVGEVIKGLVRKLGEPVVRGALRQAMKLMGNGFVLGGTVEAAKQNANTWHKKGYLFSYDMLGEGARSAGQAEKYLQSYLHAVRTLTHKDASAAAARDGISIKLSALHPRFELRQWPVLERELLPALKQLARAAMQNNILLTIDAEEATRLDVTLKVFTALVCDQEFALYQGIGMVVQAYQKRARGVIDYLLALAQQKNRRIPVRLVKGAYWDSEVKRAQVDGLENYPVFTRKAHTDISYLACARKLLENPDYFYPQFATHNARTVASILAMAGKGEYEFQRLHGMGEALYEVVLSELPCKCRIYAPVGTPEHLLSYLIRRILENGANNSFVHGLYDAPVAVLVADPLLLAKSEEQASSLPLPADIYPERKNSSGYDLGNLSQLKTLQGAITQWPLSRYPAVKDALPADVDPAFARAHKAFAAWRVTPVEKRAEQVKAIGRLLVEHESEFIALCMNEAGKTLSDAIAELREAIDYCNYYAGEACRMFAPHMLNGPSGERNQLSLHPRGVVVAISPWNFPLAIFTGQVVAALVTGNCVIAKPAEQTPHIALRAVRLMHEAGIPQDVLQLLCGRGEVIGNALVQHARTAGVVFTGSTDTARTINRALAARESAIVPLIAETGGQNCMIVDSSALLEQTVDDIIVSAFGSAGQRCSSLRVAFVQEDIADALIAILDGAVRQLKLGPVADMQTDIGPVIDTEAYGKLTAHIAAMKANAKFIAASPLPGNAEAQLLVAPHVFEIPSIDMLKGEVFGPILHIVRYHSSALDQVITQINSTGYGLTFGIESRIEEKVREVTSRIHVGNIYVNRSMIGAVVGVQPFGGQGNSGTGPKAGGPHYLPRFCVEQTVSVNTAAVGGNIELLTRPEA
jgi:RHH-type proline utilization regulon transcriptional repressor/proline dehydrogenase/delta 1-pyrroline-5-carboxylate dehydrogenase